MFINLFEIEIDFFRNLAQNSVRPFEPNKLTV